MKSYFILLLLSSFLSLVQCNSKNEQKSVSDDKIIVDNIKVKKGRKIDASGWKCYVLKNEVVCVPAEWKIVDQDKIDFFCYLNNSNENTYFVLGKFNTDFRKYLADTYYQLTNDTIEIGEGYTVKKLLFRDKVIYYCEYFTRYDNREYIMYSILFHKFNYLYDISLKVEKDTSIDFYNIFQDILFNLTMDGKPVFREKDKLKEFELIDLSKL
jgi:hypothetical protein